MQWSLSRKGREVGREDDSEVSRRRMGVVWEKLWGFLVGCRSTKLEWERPELSLEPHLCLSLYICFIISLSYLLSCSISVLVISCLVTKYPKTYWLKTAASTIYHPSGGCGLTGLPWAVLLRMALAGTAVIWRFRWTGRLTWWAGDGGCSMGVQLGCQLKHLTSLPAAPPQE